MSSMLKSRGQHCTACDRIIPKDNFDAHCRSLRHQHNRFLFLLDTREGDLVKEKDGIKISCPETGESGSIITLKCKPTDFVEVNLEIKSTLYNVSLHGTVMLEKDEMILLTNPIKDSCVNIKKNASHSLNFQASADTHCSKLFPLGLLFSRQGQKEICIMRYLRVACVDENVALLEPVNSYVAVEPLPQLPTATKIYRMERFHGGGGTRMAQFRNIRSDINFVPGEEDEDEFLPQECQVERKIGLAFYNPPNFLKQLHIDKFLEKPNMPEDYYENLEKVKKSLETGINEDEPENYSECLRTLLSFEDIQQETDIRMYDQRCVELRPFENDPERFELEVEGLEEGRPSLLCYDKIYIREADSLIEFEGHIDRTKAHSIEIVMSGRFVNFYNSLAYSDESGDSDTENVAEKEKPMFGVRFSTNRKVMRLMFRALDQYDKVLQVSPIDMLLMPRIAWPAQPTLDKLDDLELVNKNIKNNPEQLCAVRNILLGLHRPAPYILFGPPGTGKTTTISEAILQIYKMLPQSRILIVTPSNSAANVVTEKILNSGVVPKSDISRQFGFQCDERKSSPALRSISNWKETSQKFEELPLETVKGFRIVACTLSMSGSLVTVGVPRGHFTHIFIDEAGHAMEPEALIPIAGLLEIYKEGDKIGGSLILSGDHLQLGPVIRSPIAKAHGMAKSLLERIMDTYPYARRKNFAYNPMVLTKLVRNFRSHDKILEVPNKLFYENELKAHGSRDYTHELVHYSKLPQKGIPVIFHGVSGRELREANNPSFFNPEEVGIVVDYIQDLLSVKTFSGKPILQSDIGVIAPYRKQVLKIRILLKHYGFEEISVGSTEEFQGQERLIMLISTVRCSEKPFDTKPGQSLGFLRNPKRFNVAITRAKALLIVVGDPKVLHEDSRWRTLLNTCLQDGTWTGARGLPSRKKYADLFESIKELHAVLDGCTLSANGQIAITQLSLEEEPRWRDDD